MADNMLKLKIDTNLGMVNFCCKSIFNGRAMAAIFVISGNGYHPQWLTRIWLIKDGH